MPKSRTYTDTGYVEVQWSKKGHLVCLVSAERLPDEPGQKPEFDTIMHQFTQRGDVGIVARDLRRARKQAFDPFGGDAPLPA